MAGSIPTRRGGAPQAWCSGSALFFPNNISNEKERLKSALFSFDTAAGCLFFSSGLFFSGSLSRFFGFDLGSSLCSGFRGSFSSFLFVIDGLRIFTLRDGHQTAEDFTEVSLIQGIFLNVIDHFLALFLVLELIQLRLHVIHHFLRLGLELFEIQVDLFSFCEFTEDEFPLQLFFGNGLDLVVDELRFVGLLHLQPGVETDAALLKVALQFLKTFFDLVLQFGCGIFDLRAVGNLLDDSVDILVFFRALLAFGQVLLQFFHHFGKGIFAEVLREVIVVFRQDHLFYALDGGRIGRGLPLQGTLDGVVRFGIFGAVRVPGYYSADGPIRIGEAVDMAGGTAEDADTANAHLAKWIEDGETIIIPTAGSVQPTITPVGKESVIVDLNHAGLEELMKLPGIGEKRASDIIRLREQKGGFSSKEEILEISGISEKLLESIYDQLIVK